LNHQGRVDVRDLALFELDINDRASDLNDATPGSTLRCRGLLPLFNCCGFSHWFLRFLLNVTQRELLPQLR
jgi:hypothetical protein